MKKTIRLFLLSLVLFSLSYSPAVAQVATLAWDQSPQAEIASYKIYYRTGTPAFPFNGTTLAVGASPIVVNGANTTALTIDLPDDGNIYYFTATAVSATGLESGYSDIIASEWVPYLLAPTENAALDTAVTFTWGQAPVGYDVTYKLFYGTDPKLTPATMTAVSSHSGSEQLLIDPWLALLLALILALTTAACSGRRTGGWRPVRVGLCLGVLILQVSCGGGGGADGSTPAALPLSTTVIAGIAGTSYQVTDLQPGTRYYWQIVAIDNQGFQYDSVVKTFTTLAN